MMEINAKLGWWSALAAQNLGIPRQLSLLTTVTSMAIPSVSKLFPFGETIN